jgi:hypothetical protein
VLSKLAVLTKKHEVTFTLSAPASVELRVSRCAKHCRPVRSFTVKGRTGPNSTRLGRKLARGHYRLTATPTGGAAHSKKFTIAR